MPHVHIDYSANLEERVDMAELCEVIRQTAASIDALPMPGIRVRATRVDHYAIADGDPKHAFIDLSLRLRAGRAPNTKADAIARIFEALKSYLAPVIEQQSIALSAEIRDIDAELSPKFSTIRDHLEDIS